MQEENVQDEVFLDRRLTPEQIFRWLAGPDYTESDFSLDYEYALGGDWSHHTPERLRLFCETALDELITNDPSYDTLRNHTVIPRALADHLETYWEDQREQASSRRNE